MRTNVRNKRRTRYINLFYNEFLKFSTDFRRKREEIMQNMDRKKLEQGLIEILERITAERLLLLYQTALVLAEEK